MDHSKFKASTTAPEDADNGNPALISTWCGASHRHLLS